MCRFVSKFRVLLITLTTCICGYNCARSQNLDTKILMHINPDNPNSQYWKQTSQSVYWAAGALPVGTLVYGMIADDDRIKQNAVGLFMSIGADVMMTSMLKKSFNRTRPSIANPGEIFSTPASGMSLPSGHTSLAFATATTLSLQYKKWYITIPAYAWAGSVAYSRMYLGKHYPSDVAGGIIVGVGGSLATNWLNKKLFSRNYKKPQFYAQ